MHAAAGGVGLIACQWARALGAIMVGTVSTPEKAELAKAHGCAHTVIAGSGELVRTVRDLTGGQGAAVVYDSVGKDTLTESLDCLRPLGMMVSFGNASGPVPPIALTELTNRGSLMITRPTLMTFTERRDWLEEMATDLFGRVDSGEVQIPIRQRYALTDVGQAHTDLENRKTTGSTILIP
jgi:NADPH2:quinone reductase